MSKTVVAKKFPCVVATLTPAERTALAALRQDNEKVMQAMIGGGDVAFEQLEAKRQDMKRDFWHGLYKTHNLDPQRDYSLNPETGKITQESGDLDPDTI
jgi:hypothetical protein